MLRLWRRLVAASLVLVAPLALAAPAWADGVAFQNSGLVSSFVGTGKTPHNFEPAIRVGPGDQVYVAANYHNAGTHENGAELWSGAFGGPLQSDGVLPPALGGLDVDLAVGSTGNLYDGVLYSPTPIAPTGAFGIGAGTCPAGSVPNAMASCFGTQKVDLTHTDRPWLAADGPSTVYLSFHGGSSSGQIAVDKSTDAGRMWQRAGEAIEPQLRDQANDNNLHGNLVVDPRSHALYQVFATGPKGGKGQTTNENFIYMAVSIDGGSTFHDHLVYQGPDGARLNNFWPVATVDAGGTVYAGWSDGSDVWVAASQDQGTTWGAPVRISQDGPGLRSSVEPWLAGGQAGNLAVVWYGAETTSNLDPGAHWNVYFAQVRNATSTSPAISQTVVTDHSVLVGPLCTAGDACFSDFGLTRYLFEDFGVALTSNGLAVIAYGDSSDPTNRYHVGVAWQTSGSGM